MLLVPYPLLCGVTWGGSGEGPALWAGCWGQVETPICAGAAATTWDLLCTEQCRVRGILWVITWGLGWSLRGRTIAKTQQKANWQIINT